MKALLIPVLGAIEQVEQAGLDDLQRLLDVHVEGLSVDGRDHAAAYVNEEGLPHGLPANPRAIQLLGFPIVGRAVLCGFDRSTGDQASIPDDIADAVLAMSASTQRRAV